MVLDLNHDHKLSLDEVATNEFFFGLGSDGSLPFL